MNSFLVITPWRCCLSCPRFTSLRDDPHPGEEVLDHSFVLINITRSVIMSSTQLTTEEAPELPDGLALYIRNLTDTPSTYVRFFDALLVKRPSHAAFFQDLRSFREQDHIVKLLAHPTTSNATPESLKNIYRETTRSFLASRFAHPWCRSIAEDIRQGSFGAELGVNSKKQKQNEAQQREEDRQHRLLVPLWIAFRRRMMPIEADLNTFIEQHRRQQEEQAQSRSVSQHEMKADCSNHLDSSQTKASKCESGVGEDPLPSTQVRATSSVFNAEAYVMEEVDLDPVGDQQSEDASMAAKFFVGTAAAGWLASNKRARKYLLKKLNKPAR